MILLTFIITAVASIYIGWQLCKVNKSIELEDDSALHSQRFNKKELIIFVGVLYFIVLYTTINIDGLQNIANQKFQDFQSEAFTRIKTLEKNQKRHKHVYSTGLADLNPNWGILYE